MKRVWRAGLCGVLLGLTLCGTAAASEVQNVSVEINGETVVFQDEVKVVNGRTYLPFRGIFQALGFEDSAITFDGTTGTVCAESPALTVSMVIGEERMRVTRDGRTEILRVDAPAFIDPVLGRTYIPARFAAEATGYRLGWNGSSRTVILDDIETILKENQETYTVLEEYLEFLQQYRTANYQSKGEYSAEVTMGTDDISVKGSYCMLLDQSGLFELKMPMKLEADISGAVLSELLPEKTCLYAWGKQGEDIHHIRIGEEQMFGIETEQEWMTLDLNTITEESYPRAAADYIRWLNPEGFWEEQKTGQEYVKQLIQETVRTDNSVSVPELLNRINRLLGDSAFRLVKGSYVNDLIQEHTQAQVRFQTRRDNIIGYEFSVVQQAAQSQPGVELHISVSGKKWEISLTLAQTVNEYMYISMDGILEVTNQRPKGYLP